MKRKREKKEKEIKKSFGYTKTLLEGEKLDQIYRQAVENMKYIDLKCMAGYYGIKSKDTQEIKKKMPEILYKRECAQQKVIDLGELYLDFVSGDVYSGLLIINHQERLIFFLNDKKVYELHHKIKNDYHQSIILNDRFFVIGNLSSFSLNLKNLKEDIENLDLDIKRVDFSVCKYQGELYIFGGEHPEDGYVNNLEIFDLEEIKRVNLDGPKISKHKAITFNNEMIIIGGKRFDQNIKKKLLKSVWILNMQTKQWRKQKTKGQYPIKILYPSCYLDSHYVYIHGGTNGTLGYNPNEIFRLNLLTFEWNLVGYMEPRIQNSLMLIDNSTIYSFGGNSIFEPTGTNLVSIFPIEKSNYLIMTDFEFSKFEFHTGSEIVYFNKLITNQVPLFNGKNKIKMNVDTEILEYLKTFLTNGYFRCSCLKTIISIYKFASSINFENLKNYCVEIIYFLNLNKDEIMTLKELKDKGLIKNFTTFKHHLTENQQKVLKLSGKILHPKYYYGIHKYINGLKYDHSNYDTILKVKNHEFKVHKFILSKVEYFQMMFKFEEGSKTLIEMQGITETTLGYILDYIYLNQFPSKSISIMDSVRLLKQANEMLLSDLETHMIMIIISKLNSTNSQGILNFAKTYNFQNLINMISLFYLSRVGNESLISIIWSQDDQFEYIEEDIEEKPRKKTKASELLIIDDE